MPIKELDYAPPLYLRNSHLHTVYASFARSALSVEGRLRERVDTPDGDFLDLDWYQRGHDRLLIISHGLEGHSERPYVLGMTQQAVQQGWDVLAWNYRSCTGEPNRKLQSYHSGSTEDLDFLVKLAVKRGYKSVSLCGFSIGGNKTLLYLTRDKQWVPDEVRSAITFSVPIDLVATSKKLAKPLNRIYMRNFLTTLEDKLKQKKALYPEQISLEGYSRIKTFEQFDGRYTAPMNGFESAIDYWTKSSSGRHLDKLEVPTALITSLDDPFLTPSCFPRDIATENPNFHLMLTRYGGHVGFVTKGTGAYFSEQQGLSFLNDHT